MANLDDRIRQYCSGDPQLCETLMLDYYNFILRLANALLGDPCEADDAAQETFVRATTRIEQYQAGTSMKSWLARIAINACRDRLRRRSVRKRLQEVLKWTAWHSSQGTPTPEETVILNERQRAIRAGIDALDEKHRLPVLLRYVQGMAIAEIAQALEINEGTVHSRLHYAFVPAVTMKSDG